MLPTEKDRIDLLIELEKRGKRAPASMEERHQLIEKEHSLGHFGKDVIFRKLYDQDIWWPSMHRDINEIIRKCDPCLRFNVGKRGYHPTQHIHSSKPGDHYQIDLSVHLPESPDGYKAILHIIDVFTGFVILRPLMDEMATTVAQELYKVFMIIGWPRILQSDNGRQFVSDVVHSLTSMLGEMSRHISAFNPRADGKVERSIGVVMQSIKKMLHGSDTHWPLFLDFAQFVYNSKINRITGSSPFALMFNRSPNEFKDYTIDPTNPPTVNLDEWKDHQSKILSVIYPAVDERITAMSSKYRKQMDKHRRILLQPLPTGTVVMRLDPHRADKREPKYIGPYVIVRRAVNGGYILKDNDGDIVDYPVHIDQLKVAHPDAMKDLYTVHKIHDHRRTNDGYEYLVEWKGYHDPQQYDWLPAANFLDDNFIRKYWQRINQQRQ